jgi:Tol biopolymer transport system component
LTPGNKGKTEAAAQPPGAPSRQTLPVFISYATKDRATAENVCETLENHGIRCWMAPRDVPAGAEYADAIVRAINDAPALVLLMSAAAMDSSHVRREVERAASKRKTLIALRLDSAPPNAALEYFLSSSQWIDVPSLGLKAALAKLSADLSSGAPTNSSTAAAISAAPPPARAHRPARRAILGLAAAIATLVIAALFFLLPRSAEKTWQDPLADAKVMRLADFTGTEQAAAISRDGRYAAFLADRDGHLDVWLTEIGSNHYRKLTEGQTLQLSNPSVRTLGFSPDSALVTLWTRSADGSRADDVKILAAPVSGGPLSLYMQDVAEFDWSPDATRVVFHTTAPGDPLFLRAKGEGGAHQIYVAPSAGIHCHFPTWSPDGEYIYFARGEPPANWDIWRIKPTGEGLERMTAHNTRVSYPVMLNPQMLLYLATDPDGSGPWLYAMDVASKFERRVSVGLERYTSLAASAGGTRLIASVANSRSDLWRLDLNGGGPQTSASALVPPIQNAFAPRVGPGYIAYVSTGGGRRGIWKLENGIATELWNDPGADRLSAPAIAPDGRRIAFTAESHGARQLYVIDRDGAHPRTIGTGQNIRGTLAWAPDSLSIIGAIEQGGEPRLARIFLDGQPSQPLVSEYSVDPSWSPDGKYLVYSGADVGTTFPLRASGPDGRPYGMATLILTRGARRVVFARDSGSLVILRGEIGHKNFWLLNPESGAERQLSDLPSKFTIGDFDLSADAKEIIFDRVQDSSSLALFELGSRQGSLVTAR